MYSDYFKFAFVRNPLDRFVSAWKDKVLQNNYFKFSEHQRVEMKDPDRFIQYTKKLDIELCDEHLREQRSLIDLRNIDYVGRFEQFNDDFAHVAKVLNLTEFEPVHLNKSKSSKDIELNDRQKREIARIYAMDVRVFYPQLLHLLED